MAQLRSALRSAQRAKTDALKANLALMALLAQVAPIASGKGPQKPPFPNIRFGDMSEQDFLLFQDNLGKRIRFTDHIWSDKVAENDEILAIYEQMELSLNRVKLLVDGQIHLLGTLELVTMFLDPSGQLNHGVLRYEGTFLNA